MRTTILSLWIFSGLLAFSAAAHEGHIHPPSIGRSTHPYLQACVAPYLRLQHALAAGRFDDALKEDARNLAARSRAGAANEKESGGRNMLVGMAEGAEEMVAAESLPVARRSFAKINRAMLPFFKTWQGHLGEHDLSLLYCADENARVEEDKIDFSRGWMQQGDTPQTPYGGGLCADLQVERGAGP